MEDNSQDNSKNDLTLVYMVAGISSRFNGEIKQFAIIDSKGTTLIEKSLEQALPAGFNKIIFIVGNKTAEPFKEKFGDNYNGIPIHYAHQMYNPETRERPWGTADALCAAKELINESFVVANGDDLYGKNSFKIIVDHLKNNSEPATVGYKIMNVLPETGTINRGIFELEGDYVKTVNETFNIEKNNLEASNLDETALCNMNLFGLQPEILETLSKRLEEFKEENKEDKRAECFLPLELTNLTNMKLHSTPDTWYGVTNPGDELTIQKILEEIDEEA